LQVASGNYHRNTAAIGCIRYSCINVLDRNPGAIPDECNDCGAVLGGRFATDDENNPLCLDCVSIDG